MSVDEHKSAAVRTVHTSVVVVSDTRDPATDKTGPAVTAALTAAGHEVLDVNIVPDEASAIVDALQAALARDAAAVVFAGGTGASARDITPETLSPLFTRGLPGFGELFRMLSFNEIGASAMLSRATAGFVGNVPVFVLPGSPKAATLGVERLIGPELGHLVSLATKIPAAPPEPEARPSSAPLHAEPAQPEHNAEAAAALPVPSRSLGQLGRNRISLSADQPADAAPEVEPTAEDEAAGRPAGGWQRAVWELEGEVADGKWEDLPQPIENLSPVVDVLHQAGERKVMKLPNGKTYSLFGYPDLQRPSSKVLAIGWGQPLAEVLALHRYPAMTGITIEGDRGQLPNRASNIAEVCEAVTGRAPSDTEGELYALQGDTVWIQRGNKVVRWDGRREFDDGTPKQVLATLVLHWSNK